MSEVQEHYSTPTRREVLVGAAALGVGTVLVGCGRNELSSGTPPSQDPDNPRTSSASEPLSVASVKSSAVPVGGGTVIGDVVVTQPQAGVFMAFSATCTHRGCHVSDVSGGTINCPCHGAEFSISDGSVARGPASTPLSQRGVTLDGDTVTIV
jgi:Rieske Fe-S protein